MPHGTVLVVDDDPIIVALLEAALVGQGYQVHSSANGAAIQAARDLQPDVILLDLMMPEMDGAEVSKRLREDPQTAMIPIVVMSAAERLRAKATEMQVNDRLSKPFTIRDVLATVERWMRAR
ncbi:MAG TPA: response regulator [Chloroflexota bacterium]|nr:response regulator [Chloroflexota bacterium]